MKAKFKNMQKFLSFILIFGLIALLGTGCSLLDDDDDSDDSFVNQGVFVDSAVHGINYKTDTQEGTTDEDGKFKYVDGEKVTFSIGDIILGESWVKPVMTPVDLVDEAEDENDPTVTNITRFLMTLDDDDDPDNGIYINERVKDKAKDRTVDFKSENFDAHVQETVADLTKETAKGETQLIDSGTAQEHLKDTLSRESLKARLKISVRTGAENMGEITSVKLDVQEVEACGDDGACKIVGGQGTIDLLDPDNNALVVGDILLDQINISQLRFVLGNENKVVVDGVTHDLTVPSGDTSGLKIILNDKINVGELKEILLDFDPEKSVSYNQGQGYKLDPTIKALEILTAPGTANTSVIDPEKGGQLKVKDDFDLLVPGGATDEHKILWTDEEKGESSEDYVTSVFTLGPEGTSFPESVKVKLTYDPNDIPEGYSEDDLVILHDNEPVATIVDKDAKTLEAEIEHFSTVQGGVVCHAIITYAGSENGPGEGPNYRHEWKVINTSYNCDAENYQLGSPEIFRLNGSEWVSYSTDGFTNASYPLFSVLDNSANSTYAIAEFTFTPSDTGSYRIYFEIFTGTGDQLGHFCETYPGKCRLYTDIEITEVIPPTLPLQTPILTSPQDNSQDQTTTLKLDWNPVENATVYRVLVATDYTVLDALSDTDMDCPGCVINTTVSPNDYYDVPEGYLDESTTYYWMVRAGNDNSGSHNSNIQSFTTLTSSTNPEDNQDDDLDDNEEQEEEEQDQDEPEDEEECETVDPEIHYMDVWQDGKGFFIVTVKATDNVAVKEVELVFNGESKSMNEMGDDIYKVSGNYSSRELISFEVTATDDCGNSGNFSRDVPASWSDEYGSTIFKGNDPCGKGTCGTDGDPVNTLNGNFVYQTTDALLRGLGNTTIKLERVYNSMAALWTSASVMRFEDDGDEEVLEAPPQYFGRAWTFPYNTYLLEIDEELFFEGIQIQYPDGRTIMFKKSGSSYTPDTPGIFDVLTKDGTEYVLSKACCSLEEKRFNSDGKLVSTSDKNGNFITLTYSNDNLTRIENSANRWMTFSYNSDGLITEVGMPEGLSLKYEYSDDLLTAFIDARGKRTEYRYNSDNQLTQIITPKGHSKLSMDYDSEWRATKQIIGATEQHSFSYSTSSTTITDAYSNTSVHHYDSEGRLVKEDFPDGTSEEFAYDDNFNRTYYKDKSGKEWTWTYDSQGNRLTADGPLGWHREWEYNELNKVTRMAEKVDASTVRETTFEYDSNGNLTKTCNFLGNCATITYDSNGLPTSITDFAGNQTTNTYDSEGNLISVTNPENAVTRFEHDALGRVIQTEKPIGAIFTYSYDSNGNLLSVNGPLSYSLSFEYDDNNNLIVRTDPNSGKITYTYNESDKPLTITNQLDFTVASYAYGLMNEITGITDAEGRTTSYEYDPAMRINHAVGPLNTDFYYTYNQAGKITDITDPMGYITHTAYDDLHRPTAIVRNYLPSSDKSADANVETGYEYDLVGNLLKITDPENNGSEFVYDLMGRKILARDAEANEQSYVYDNMNNLVSVTDPRGNSASFTYTSTYRVEKIVDPKGEATTYTYDIQGRLTDKTDKMGIITHFEYDDMGRLIRKIVNYDPPKAQDSETNVTSEYEYDLAGNLLSVTNPRDHEAQFTYDAAHRRISIIDYENANTSFTYDRVNNLLTVTDPNNHVTAYTYDDLNRRITAVNPENHATAFTYDQLGNLTEIINANGNPTKFEIDALGRVISKTDALNGKLVYEYNSVGKPVRKTDPNNHSTNYVYDKIYKMVSVTNAENSISAFQWDPNGNLTMFTDSNNNSATYNYDELNRLISVTNAENETTGYFYNSEGKKTSIVEPDQTVKQYEYDPLYRLKSVTENYIQDAAPATDVNVLTAYTYDPMGNLIEITNANNAVTSFDYDAMGRKIKETDPLNNISTFTYDPAGNRIARTDANENLTQYSYYPDNMLETIAYSGTTSVEYTYDANNNRISMTDNLGITQWTYDQIDRLIKASDPFDRILEYAYDPVGNRTSIIYPDGNKVSYTYSPTNRLETVTDPMDLNTIYDRDSIGNILKITNPNSTVAEITYDNVYRILTLVNRQTEGAKKTNSAFDYTYNELGHVTKAVKEFEWRNPDVVTEDYTYDGLHRLTGMTDTDGTQMSYSYDVVGNRLTWTSNDDMGSSTPLDGFRNTYEYNSANQLLTLNIDSDSPNGDLIKEYAYDANGNRINRLESDENGPLYGIDYTFDPENRLIKALDYKLTGGGDNRIDSAVTDLEYDGGGRRLVKTYDPKEGGGGEKRIEYVFDGLDPVAEYSILDGKHDNFYRGAMNRIITMHNYKSGTEGQMYWYHYNFKGDVVGMTKQNGQSHHNYRYDPYGNVLDSGNFTDPHNHYTLTGKEYDEDMGLFWFGARHYDGEVGVWLTQDLYRGEFSIPASLHRLSYVHCDPINYWDFMGLWDNDGLKKAFKEKYGDNALVMKKYNTVLNHFSLEQGDFYLDDWDVYYEEQTISIASTIGFGEERSNENAAKQLYDALSEVFIEEREFFIRDYAEQQAESVINNKSTSCQTMANIWGYASDFYKGCINDDEASYARDVSYILSGANFLATDTDNTQVRGFSDDGFKSEFQDGSNQVQHFSAGVWAGFQYEALAYFFHDNLRPDSPEDEALNDKSTYLGASFNWVIGPDISEVQGWIEEEICE